jgi:hypothetical protein
MLGDIGGNASTTSEGQTVSFFAENRNEALNFFATSPDDHFIGAPSNFSKPYSVTPIGSTIVGGRVQVIGESDRNDFDLVGQSLSVAPQVVSAAPEPATWICLILGFGLVGSAMRSVRHATRSAVKANPGVVAWSMARPNFP